MFPEGWSHSEKAFRNQHTYYILLFFVSLFELFLKAILTMSLFSHFAKGRDLTTVVPLFFEDRLMTTRKRFITGDLTTDGHHSQQVPDTI